MHNENQRCYLTVSPFFPVCCGLMIHYAIKALGTWLSSEYIIIDLSFLIPISSLNNTSRVMHFLSLLVYSCIIWNFPSWKLWYMNNGLITTSPSYQTLLFYGDTSPHTGESPNPHFHLSIRNVTKFWPIPLLLFKYPLDVLLKHGLDWTEE